MKIYRDKLNYHRHKCHFCSYVWEHHNVNDVKHGDSGSHECPNCKHCNWSLGIYKGDEAPESINGNDPGPAVVAIIHPDQQKETI